MNPMQQRRLRASRRQGNPGPWNEVIQQQQQQQQPELEEEEDAPLKKPLIGSPPQIDEDHRRPQRMRAPRTPAPRPDPGRAMWSSSNPGSDTFSCLHQGLSSPSENSEEQWCGWPRMSQDPSKEGSESSVVTDDEAIAVQSLLSLELRASSPSIQDSAASKKKKTRRTARKKTPTGIVTRLVFVPCLGFSILQRRVESRRAAPRIADLSHPGLGESDDGDSEPARSRSKRKRAGKMPPKFQDTVLLKQQQKPKRKKSRRV